MTISDEDNQRLRELAAHHPHLFRGVLLPWFTPESWSKMREVAADRDNLASSFEEFERTNVSRFNDLVAKGHPAEKFQIDVDALIAWCRAEGRPLDGKARQMFAILSLIERDKKAGHA